MTVHSVLFLYSNFLFLHMLDELYQKFINIMCVMYWYLVI